MSDILHRVLLSQRTVERWQTLSGETVRQMPADPGDIPDEQAELQEDGTLLLFVDVPKYGRIALTVPVGEWDWLPRQPSAN